MVGNARSHPHTPIFHGNGVPPNAPSFFPILVYASHPWPHTLFVCDAQFFLYRSIRSIRITITSFIYITHTLHSCEYRSISFFIFIYTNVVYHIIDTGIKFSVGFPAVMFSYRYKKKDSRRSPYYLFSCIRLLEHTYLRFLARVSS